MAKHEQTISFLQTTDGEFRTWVQDLIDCLLAIGMQQTADTGQIDTSTVLAPTAVNQVRGYAMFTPDDGLTDWYLKVEFGSGANGAASPRLWMTWGWATDGAGTFTGLQISERFSMQLTGTNAGTSSAICRFCKSGSAITMWTNITNLVSPSALSRSVGIMFDRSREWDTGVATTDSVTGFITFDAAGGYLTSPTLVSGNNVQHTVPASGGVGIPAPGSVGNALVFSRLYTTGSWSRRPSMGVAPICGWDGGPTASVVSGLIYIPPDAAKGTIFAASMYGTARTYVATHLNASAPDIGARLALLWE